MTSGQQRAIRELERLSATDQDGFELIDTPFLKDEWLVATIGFRLGLIETQEGGLDLREREEFILRVPPGYPFDRPVLQVAHVRFAGFPHVIWAKTICLYQSSIAWNPSDGLYGFFDRLHAWLGKAAINDMDPLEGPLEPPHHITDFTQHPFVIRANAPCAAGDSWIGLALLEKHPNRTELVAWNDLSGEWPKDRQSAFAVVLPKALPMEFPSDGTALFQEIEKAGMKREHILINLGIAALLSPEGAPMHLVLGLPMRRAVDGSPRLHVAVWTTDADTASALRKLLPQTSDSESIRNLRRELRDALAVVFERSNIKWCQVFEDRSEVVVRRDRGTPIAWFAGKKVLILGCGALGSWLAEIVARAKPNLIHLVDNFVVKPGVLARQNFGLADVGVNKATALARRLNNIIDCCVIIAYAREAHSFLIGDVERLKGYDVVLDCTASSIFQMKLERDWASFADYTPPIISLVIDGHAKRSLCVVIGEHSKGGIWDAYMWLKNRLCIEGSHTAVTRAFYSESSVEMMFQPEPGCSDPTFTGSTADIVYLASGALNAAVRKLQAGEIGFGIALSAPEAIGPSSALASVELPQFYDTVAGDYRIRIEASSLTQAKAWVNQNNRLRSPSHETGGLLWGYWDDAVQVIWIFALSGPPLDSQHSPGHFLCGIAGTLEEHKRRVEQTYGACGFIGHWHTHPELPPTQSSTDMVNMAALVSSIGQNQKRSVMIIFGRAGTDPTAGVYIYESNSIVDNADFISVGMSQFTLKNPVV